MTDPIRTFSSLSAGDRVRILRLIQSGATKEADQLHKPQPRVPSKNNRPADIPASYWQEQMWVLEHLAGHTANYNVPFAFRIEGELNPNALSEAFNAIMHRHEVLRTSLREVDGRLTQKISSKVSSPLSVRDLSNALDPEEEAWLRARDLARSRFPLDQPPLFKIELMQLDSPGKKHMLVLVCSHAIADGWSIGVIASELSELYRRCLGCESLRLDPLPTQFADYAICERQRLTGQRLDRLVDYWRYRLENSPRLCFPLDSARPAVRSYEGGTHEFVIQSEICARVKALSISLSVTPFVVLLAVYKLNLFRWSNQADLIVGSASAGRDSAETEGLVGPFQRTFALRSNLASNPRFSTFCKTLHNTVVSALEHNDLPVSEVVKVCARSEDSGHNPLWQTFFLFDSLPGMKREVLLSKNTIFQPIGISNQTVKFDFEMAIEPRASVWFGRFDYSSEILRLQTASRFVDDYVHLIDRAAMKPNSRLSEILELTQSEREEVVRIWRANGSSHLVTRTLVQTAARIVAENPESKGIVSIGESVTLREIALGAERLNRNLRRLGLRKGSPVCICTRTWSLLTTAVLGTMRAGGAVVLLDPDDESARIEAIIRNCGAAIWVHDGEHFPPRECAPRMVHLSIREPSDAKISEEYGSMPSNLSESDLAALCHVVAPKRGLRGVELTHAALANSMGVLSQWIRASDSLLVQGSLTRDTVLLDILLPLVTGAKLVVSADDSAQGCAPDTIEAEAISVVIGSSSFLRRLLTAGWRRKVRLVICYSDTPSDDLWNHLDERADVVRWISGHAEAGFVALIGEGKPSSLLWRTAPNVKAYVLERRRGPCALGHVGDLWISGNGVARGYYNDRRLTQARMPFDRIGQMGRSHKTLLKAKCADNGEIEVVKTSSSCLDAGGRQVPLTELESALRDKLGLEVVVIPGSESQYGLSFVTVYFEGEPLTDQMETEARMAVNFFVPATELTVQTLHLAMMPRLASGKPDRSTIAQFCSPPHEEVRSGSGRRFQESSCDTILEIWKNVLGREAIGVDEEFFALGGHSLQAVRIVRAIRRKFDVELGLQEFFTAKTIDQLARFVDQLCAGTASDDTKERVLRLVESMGSDEINRLLHGMKGKDTPD